MSDAQSSIATGWRKAVRAATSHWLAQRGTAIAMLALGGWFAATLAGLTGLNDLSYASASAFFSQSMNAILMGLLCLSLAYHSYLGIQVVIEDYVHSPRLNAASLMLSRVVHALVALVSLYALYQIGFSA